MAASKTEVEMTVDTFNIDMGGRLRNGNVYSMSPEHADHLMAMGFAKKPTAKGRTLTEQTQEEELTELRARLAALEGTPPDRRSMTVGDVGLATPPSPQEPAPALEGQPPVVRTAATRRRLGIPDLHLGDESPSDTETETTSESEED